MSVGRVRIVSNWWRVKDSLYLTLAALFILMGALGILIAVMYLLGLPRYDPSIAPAIGSMCFLTGILPGIVFVVLGLRARKKERELVEFAAWVRTYRRGSLHDLASKLGKTEFEMEKVLVEVVDKNLVPGFIDRSTNEFVLQEAVGQEQFIERCPHCGATLQRPYFRGETVLCPYCNSVIIGRDMAERK